MEQVTTNIHIESGYLAPNVWCVLTGEGAVLIDSPFLPSAAKHWGLEISGLAEGGIAYLINTHCHGACNAFSKNRLPPYRHEGPVRAAYEVNMFLPIFLP